MISEQEGEAGEAREAVGEQQGSGGGCFSPVQSLVWFDFEREHNFEYFVAVFDEKRIV